MDARLRTHDRKIMMFGTGGAPEQPDADKNHEQSVDETPTVFERAARRQAPNGDGEYAHQTSSVFEWTTPQQAAHQREENLKKTSMIFERPSRRRTVEHAEERAKSWHTVAAGDDAFGRHGSSSAVTNLSHAIRPIDTPRDNSHASSLTEQDLIGRTLANKYTIESVIGTGSMGTVYRARQLTLDKWVSIKILHQELVEQRTFVERFKLEAFAASRLEHPNLLRVLDFGTDGNLLHLVMEYVEADDLLTVMRNEWPFDDARMVKIMSQALAALAKAHDVGIVHRDLKPENILILRGTDDEGNATDIVKVCDFGIAKMAGASTSNSRPFAPQLTTEGLVVGTPDYMSPEQARGERVDGRSDLYSLGVVLYQLLAGRTPFAADTPFGIAIQHVSQPPISPSRHRAVHPVLERICLCAISKRPQDRFQSARDMRRALLNALTPPIASDITPPHAIPTAPVYAMAAPVHASTPMHGMPAPVHATPGPVHATLTPVNDMPRVLHATGTPVNVTSGHAPASVEWTASRASASVALWKRYPNAVVAAAALVGCLIIVLAAVLSSLRDSESSRGNENVVPRAASSVPTLLRGSQAR